MDRYEQLLHVVAENPGCDEAEIVGHIDRESNTTELLTEAEERDDVVCFNGRYWVVRKGEFAVSEYDHPET